MTGRDFCRGDGQEVSTYLNIKPHAVSFIVWGFWLMSAFLLSALLHLYRRQFGNQFLVFTVKYEVTQTLVGIVNLTRPLTSPGKFPERTSRLRHYPN